MGLYMIRFVFIALLTISFSATAQLSLGALNSPATADFTGFSGSGFVPAPAAGQLDSDTYRITGLSDGDGSFGGTHTAGDFARGASTGGETGGGIYGFDVGGGNIALGVQPTGGDFTPGAIEVRVVNNTGDQIDSVDVSYDIFVNNDAERGNTFNFAYSTDGTNFTSVGALDFTSTEVSDANGFVSVARMTTISGLAANFQNGDTLTLQFSGADSLGGGSRDEFGLDNLSITATTVPVELMEFQID